MGADSHLPTGLNYLVGLSAVKEQTEGFPPWLSGLSTQLVTMRTWVPSLALLSGLRIQCCHEVLCFGRGRGRPDFTLEPEVTFS